jgi:propionyl-CoA carboxylase beta chain
MMHAEDLAEQDFCIDRCRACGDDDGVKFGLIHRDAIAKAADPAAERARLIKEYEQKFSNPYVSAELGYSDEVIEPALTRRRLIDSLEMLKNKRDITPPKKHGNIPL